MKKALLLFIEILLVFNLPAQQAKELQRVEKNGKWGYADDKGNEVVRCKYDRAFPFYESDLALVESEGKFGYVNKEGRIVIPFQYKKAYPFSDGRAAVKKGKRFGFITESGIEIIKPQYTDVKWGYIEGYAWVKKGNKWGVIDKKDNSLVNFSYINLSYFDPNTGAADAITKEGNIHYYIAGRKYNTKRERDEVLVPPPSIIWPDMPSIVSQPQYVLNAKIKSDSKIEYCEVYLNDNGIPKDITPGGSYNHKDIIEKSSYNISISETLHLREGLNTVSIKVKNAGGEIEDQKTIEYKKPVLNKPVVVINSISDTTNSPQLTVMVDVASEGEITSCDLYLEKNCDGTKGSHIAPDIIEGQKKEKFSKTMSRTFTLCEGENVIVAEASNAAGTTKVEKKVTYEKPEPPTIVWDGIVPENTTKETLEVKATINSKTDVTWRITKSTSGKTKGSNVAADIIENEVASGKGNRVNGQMTLSPGYNTITIEATNVYGKEHVSKKVWYSPCEKRIALVIGNKNYKGEKNGGFAPLEKTLNDADTIAKLLENECGFDVIKAEDANHTVMEDQINKFINRVKSNGYKTAFVYYSGHGASYDRLEGDNYLIPIDCADCTDSIKAWGIEVRTRILQRLEKEIGGSCPVKIAMLDCCRTYKITTCSPIPGSSGNTRGSEDMVGLSEMRDLPKGVAILYGAEFGHPSYDGVGANSPFVECFVKYVREHPKSNWRDLGFDVRKMVDKMTENYVNPITQKRDPQNPYPDIYKFDNADKFYLNPYHDKP